MPSRQSCSVPWDSSRARPAPGRLLHQHPSSTTSQGSTLLRESEEGEGEEEGRGGGREGGGREKGGREGGGRDGGREGGREGKSEGIHSVVYSYYSCREVGKITLKRGGRGGEKEEREGGGWRSSCHSAVH